MYDHIEAAFAPGEVEVIVRADHPTLNRTVAEMLQSGVRIDVLATHSKYAPSQVEWLSPLDAGIHTGIDTGDLSPAAVELCKYRGQQWCVPRLIDVRLLWTRSDRIDSPPSTWTQLEESAAVFGFTGRESGAFGMFFELVVGNGGELFNEDLAPTMNSDVGVEALATMKALAQRAPADLPSWHYDQVDRALLDGKVDMAAAWPGGWSSISTANLPLAPSLYPAGTRRSVSYSGCHAWAIPRTCGDVIGATELVNRLIGFDAQLLDASGGSICAHINALCACRTNQRNRRTSVRPHPSHCRAHDDYLPIAADFSND